jgi:6-phosphogluconate dehydrogenase
VFQIRLPSAGDMRPRKTAQRPWRSNHASARRTSSRCTSVAAQLGIPSPGFSSALAYYDALRAERLPAALIQGQRDTLWAEDGRPQEQR